MNLPRHPKRVRNSFSSRRLRGGVAVIAFALMTAGLSIAPAAADHRPGESILIYGPSLGNPPNNEQNLAIAEHYAVTVWSAETWASKTTTADFAVFDAIVFGDPSCTVGTGTLEAAESNREIWSPAVTGPKVVIGTDPTWHANGEGEGREPLPAASTLTTNAINFAASGSGTGLYASLSCYYISSGSPTSVTFLDQFGPFMVHGEPSDTVAVVDVDHPTMAGLSTESLSNWLESVHEVFDAHPADFSNIVMETGSDPDLPYIIATPAAPDPPADEDRAQAPYDGTQQVTVETTRDTQGGFYSRIVVPPGLSPGVVSIEERPASEFPTFCGGKPCLKQVQISVLPEGTTSPRNPIHVFFFFPPPAPNRGEGKLYVKGDDETVASVVPKCVQKGVANPAKCWTAKKRLPNGDVRWEMLWRDGGDPIGAKRR